MTYLSAPPDVFGDETEAHLQQALELSSKFTTGPRMYLPGSVWSRLGSLREAAGDKSGAEAAYRAAIAGLSAPRGDNDRQPPPVIGEQAFARERLASLLMRTSRLEEARKVLDESISDLRGLTDRRGPGPRIPREVLAMALYRQADVLDKLGEHTAATKSREDAERIMNSHQGGFGPGGPKKDGKKDGPRKK